MKNIELVNLSLAASMLLVGNLQSSVARAAANNTNAVGVGIHFGDRDRLFPTRAYFSKSFDTMVFDLNVGFEKSNMTAAEQNQAVQTILNNLSLLQINKKIPLNSKLNLNVGATLYEFGRIGNGSGINGVISDREGLMSFGGELEVTKIQIGKNNLQLTLSANTTAALAADFISLDDKNIDAQFNPSGRTQLVNRT
ncbi:MAG: hypothetical protein ABL927_14870, partial [Bdellovibrionales bacterium]